MPTFQLMHKPGNPIPCSSEPISYWSCGQKESKPSLGSYDSAGNGLEGQLADQQRRIADLEVSILNCVWSAGLLCQSASISTKALHHMLQAQVDEWHKAAREGTGSYDSKLALDPRSILAELRRGRSGDKMSPAEVPGLQQKEQRLRMMVAEKDLELLDLRRHMFTARQAASPHIAQAGLPHPCKAAVGLPPDTAAVKHRDVWHALVNGPLRPCTLHCMSTTVIPYAGPAAAA